MHASLSQQSHGMAFSRATQALPHAMTCTVYLHFDSSSLKLLMLIENQNLFFLSHSTSPST
jgi:hypothetical protein